MSESIKYIEENHYLKVEQVISEEEASYFYDYIKLAAKRLSVLEERQPELNEEDMHHFGTFQDSQAPGDYSKYGDLAFDTLLARKLPLMQTMTGLDLIPTYA